MSASATATRSRRWPKSSLHGRRRACRLPDASALTAPRRRKPVFTDNPTWAQIAATVKERKAIGQKDVWLGSEDRDDLDWSKCVGLETGGSHRLDISTSVWFYFDL